MKKLLLGSLAGVAPIVIIMMLGIIILAGGVGSGAASPVPVPADEEEAYEYQYIGSELGVPWDIVMLVDAIRAYDDGEGSLKNCNPMLTSLEFCIIQEEKFVLETTEIEVESPEASEEGGEEAEATQETDEASEESADETAEGGGGKQTETVSEWVSTGEILTYAGCDAILQYIGKNREDAKITYKDASGIVTDINEAAEKKGVEDQERYEVVLLSNDDYSTVLSSFVGLEDKHVSAVLELYEASYLAQLYGYTYDFSDLVLPEIVQGNVTRNDLAAVAVSLLGHPYLMGGKSSEVGAPSGPLDCSGYVDWVYVQCFGVPVGNGGTVPEGVSVSGTAIQWYASEAISEKDLQIGDLGFVRDPASVKNGQVNHVGIYIGSSDGKNYWIHCGGSSYGTTDSPKGRVGISLKSGSNSYNPVDGSSFSPEMKACNFKYFRRPRFEFVEE